MIGIAFLVSIPLTYYLITGWLSNFTKRIEIGGLAFILAGVSVFVFAGLSVSVLSFKATAANPVDSLRED